MACGTAGIVGLFIYKVFSGSYSLVRSINCSITGMVSLCAGCNLFAPWASCVVAAVGASAYLLLSGLLVAFRVDDPVDAIAVHGAGGIVGILAVPVFMEVIGIEICVYIAKSSDCSVRADSLRATQTLQWRPSESTP